MTIDGETCAPPVQDLKIAEIIPHPLYNNPPFQHDIGLLRVDPPINLSVGNNEVLINVIYLHLFLFVYISFL